MENRERLLTLPLLLSICATTIGVSLLFGYNIGVLNSPSQLIKTWIQNESYPHLHQKHIADGPLETIFNWIVSSYILGAVVGALVCGYIADKLGRKRAMMLSALLAIGAGVMMGISKLVNVYILLLIGRVIVGVSTGLGSILAPMYMTEIAPLRFRGLLGSVNVVGINFGLLVAQVLGLPYLLGTEQLWPVLLAFNILPSLLPLLALPFCPESPKYLLMVKKKEKKATYELMKLRKTTNIDDEMKAMMDEMTESNEKGDENNKTSKNGFFWWSMSICIVTHITMQLCGICSIVFFSVTIFREQAKMDNDQAAGATLGIGLVLVLANATAAGIIDKFGRRSLMLIGLIACCICNSLICLTLHLLAIDEDKYHWAVYACIVFMYLSVISFGLGPGPIPWFYANEMIEPSRRAKANTIAIAVNWIALFVVTFAFLPLKDVMGEFVFLLYAGSQVFSIIFLYFFAPETKARLYGQVAQDIEARKPKCF